MPLLSWEREGVSEDISEYEIQDGYNYLIRDLYYPIYDICYNKIDETSRFPVGHQNIQTRLGDMTRQ